MQRRGAAVFAPTAALRRACGTRTVEIPQEGPDRHPADRGSLIPSGEDARSAFSSPRPGQAMNSPASTASCSSSSTFAARRRCASPS